MSKPILNGGASGNSRQHYRAPELRVHNVTSSSVICDSGDEEVESEIGYGNITGNDNYWN